jgi:putative ABC transport system ATP-binding protein
VSKQPIAFEWGELVLHLLQSLNYCWTIDVIQRDIGSKCSNGGEPLARTPVIRLKNVVKKFFLGNDEITILKGIDLEIYSGEYIILFGASGSGKSTILNTICGLEPPTEGEVVIRGENIAKFTTKELAKYRRSKIGIVFQQFNLIKTFKVWENVAFPLTTDHVPRIKRKERALMLLELLGLGKMAMRRPTELSGGQQQRVAIARALATNPWIIIADEPTGNLDSKSANDAMTIFRLLNQKSRRTIVMVTHNPDYIKEADRVFFIEDGKIAKVQTNRTHTAMSDDIKGLEDLKNLSYHDHDEDDAKPKAKAKPKIDIKPEIKDAS